LLDLAAPFLMRDSLCLFLKGERFNEELTLARKGWTMAVSVEQSLSDRRGVVLSLQQVAREPRQA
jgi:16S rRNA (guanine527-N7)-methyltransferase